MIFPIKNANNLIVTSKFGYREFKYQGKWVKGNHYGIDLNKDPFDRNAEIVAVYDGEVVGVNNVGSQYGNMCYVNILHKDGWYTRYYHLKSRSITVKRGDKVTKGQVIGIIGATGMATGVHLHFQIDKGDKASAIDPWDYLFNGKNLIGDETPNETVSSNIYIVKKGDTLSSIARKHNTTWLILYEKNKTNIDERAKRHGVRRNYFNYIYPGQELKLP